VGSICQLCAECAAAFTGSLNRVAGGRFRYRRILLRAACSECAANGSGTQQSNQSTQHIFIPFESVERNGAQTNGYYYAATNRSGVRKIRTGVQEFCNSCSMPQLTRSMAAEFELPALLALACNKHPKLSSRALFTLNWLRFDVAIEM